MAGSGPSKLHKLTAEAQALLEEKGIALQPEKEWPRWRHFAHFWVMVGRAYVRNRCPVRAAALAYTTVLSLVPLLAVVISVSTALLQKQGSDPIRAAINQFVSLVAPLVGVQESADEEVAQINRAHTQNIRNEVVQKIYEYIENVHSQTLGVIAVAGLIFVAISLLSTIESTFNDMWGVTQGRRWVSRVVQYWAAISLGPIFVVAAVALTSAEQFEKTRAWIEQTPFFGVLVVRILPYLILSGVLGLLYLLLPNTKVTWRAALLGGVVAGLLLQLNNRFNVSYVSKAVSYNKIYGPLGIVPIFLLGLYFAWLIVLFGAQVAYGIQNRKAYVQEKQAERVNQRGREYIALRLMTEVSRRFLHGLGPPTSMELSEKLGVPLRLVCQVMGVLMERRLVIEGAGGAEGGYFPGRPLERITVSDILEALRTGQGSDVVTAEDADREAVRNELAAVQRAEGEAGGLVTMQALAGRASQ